MTDLEVLIENHQNIDDEIDKMSIMRYLSPRERDQLKGMKIQRLWYRDAIDRITRSMEHD